MRPALVFLSWFWNKGALSAYYICGQNLLHTETGAHRAAHNLAELFVYVLSGAKE